MERMKIHTWTGRQIDLMKISVDDIDIKDIARSLSMQNRYLGHVAVPVSVAKHSVMLTKVVEPEYRLEALLHDAAEAYVGDMVAPVKELIPEFSYLEGRVDKVIRKAFGLPETPSERVKEMDEMMRVGEMAVRGGDFRKWYTEPLRDCKAFLEAYNELTGAFGG